MSRWAIAAWMVVSALSLAWIVPAYAAGASWVVPSEPDATRMEVYREAPEATSTWKAQLPGPGTKDTHHLGARGYLQYHVYVDGGPVPFEGSRLDGQTLHVDVAYAMDISLWLDGVRQEGGARVHGQIDSNGQPGWQPTTAAWYGSHALPFDLTKVVVPSDGADVEWRFDLLLDGDPREARVRVDVVAPATASVLRDAHHDGVPDNWWPLPAHLTGLALGALGASWWLRRPRPKDDAVAPPAAPP